MATDTVTLSASIAYNPRFPPTNTVTLSASIAYNPRFPPTNAKKSYVARIKGPAAGALKFDREFLGESAQLHADDAGLYERQLGDKKGGATRYYHVVLSHPEHGVMASYDCEGEAPKIAKLLGAGISIYDAVEVTDIRPHASVEGRMTFTATARTKAQAAKASRASMTPVEAAVAACRAALEGLTPEDRAKVVAAL